MPDVTIHLSDEEAVWLRTAWQGKDPAKMTAASVLVRVADALPQPLPWKTVNGIELCTVGDRHAVKIGASCYVAWTEHVSWGTLKSRSEAEAFLRAFLRGGAA